MDLLTVGEAFEDLIFAGLDRLPRRGEELRAPVFAAAMGGGALISACAAARLGLSVTTLTAVDAAVTSTLRRENIRVLNVRRDGERGAVSVALSLPHDRSFVTYDGVNAVLQPRLIAALRRRAPRARHVHFALSPASARPWLSLLQHLHRHGVSTSWDFGWNERLLSDAAFPRLLDAVQWLFLNEQEARLYAGASSTSGARARWMTRAGGTVIKRGARGALVLHDGRTLRHEGIHARVVDTTGAGDAFNGAFLAALARGGTVEDALGLAIYVSARSTEGIGGIAGLPRAGDVPRAWRRRLGAA